LRVRPPAGDGWLHEVKFDGYRCQLHKTVDDVVIFSKNGREFTNRFPGIRDAVLTLPCKELSSMANWWPARRTARLIFPALHSGNGDKVEMTRVDGFSRLQLNDAVSLALLLEFAQEHVPRCEHRRHRRLAGGRW
jgi:ATP dependent DNA ligase domain